MDEVRAVEWNGYTVASLFAGAGGSSLGYRMAGFRVLYANEFVPAAADVYDANRAPYTIVDRRDVRTVDAASIAEQIVAAWRTSCLVPELARPFRELDVLDGSPPCRSFSTAGRRSKVWGKSKQYSEGISQRDDDLFYEYARILRELRPRVFVAENVTGLIKGVSKGYFKRIVAELRAAGYVVAARVLDASRLGVPQARQRVFLVGVRDDLAARGIAPAFPTPLPYSYSVRDAIGDLTELDFHRRPNDRRFKGSVDDPMPTVLAHDTDYVVEGATGFDGHAGRSVDAPMENVTAKRAVRLMPRGARARPLELDEPAPTVMQHGRRGPRSRSDGFPNEVQLGVAVGREYDKLLPGESSDRYFSLVRPDEDAPSPTVTAIGGTAAAGVAHPSERRKFTIAELRRVCSFPDDFVLLGTYSQQWERLGRAVPPLMMRALASTIRDDVLRAADAATLTPATNEKEA